MSLDNKVVDLADLKVSHDYLLGRDELLSDRINELGSGIDGIQSQITALGNGSPIPVDTVAEMTDNTKAYLYTGSEQGYTSGYWYTYDSTQAKFVPRGEYGAGVIIDSTLTVTGNAADAKATGDAIKAVKTFVVQVPGSAAVLSGSITAGDFAKALAAYTAGSGVYAVKDGEVYQLSAVSSSTMTFTQMYHGTMNFIKQIQITSADTFTVTNTALSSSATDTSYSNTASGLTATNVQAAIDENAAAISNTNGRLGENVSDLKSALSYIKAGLNGNNHSLTPRWHYGYISGGTGTINDRGYTNTNRYSDLFFAPKGTVLASTYSYNTNIYSFTSTGTFVERLGTFKTSTKTIENDTYIRLSMELKSTDATEAFNPNTYITITIPAEEYALIADLQNDVAKLEESITIIEPTYSKVGAISNLTVAPVTFPVSIVSGHTYKARYKTSSDLEQNSFYLQIWPTESILDPSTVLKNFGNVWGTDDTSNWLEYTFVADADYDGYFRFGYAVDTVPSGVTEWAELYDETDTTYFNATEIDQRVTALESAQSFWAGKKIVWFGTSIPAGVVNAGDAGGNGAYPTRIGEMLGATVYNEAVGSSAARIGMHGSITESDPNGYAGVPATCCLLSLSGTVEEKQDILDDWAYWSTVFTIGVDQIDTSNPDKYLNCSYERKLAKYLTGGSIGQCDLYVFDHGYNDAGNLNGSNYSDTTDIPTNPLDRTYFIGAMNFLIDQIKQDNYRASIVVISHYNDEGQYADLVKAQSFVANKWNIPFINISNSMGFSTARSVTINGTTKTMKNWWLPDGIHPSSDTTGKTLKHYAEVLYPFIRDAR